MKSKGIVIGICIADVMLLIVCVVLYLNQDRTAPVISFGENSVVYMEGMDTALLLDGVKAEDNEDGDVSETILIEKISDTAKGDVLVTYVALDHANNVAKASQIFPVKMSAGGQEESEETETNTGDEEFSDPQTDSENGNDGQEPDDRNEELDENVPQEGQARQDEGQENNENGQNEAGADENPADGGGENVAPVLRLSKEVLTVKAGSESVNWNDCIRSLSDDKDSREQLFSNLVMEGQVDLGTPGEYPVTVYTRDSEGADSEKRNVVVKVEEG